MEQRDDAVVREVRIAARPDIVFPYFTDPDRMVRWKGVRANLDPKPGGVYHVQINEQVVAHGEYVSIEPYRRVVFTFGWEGEGSAVPPGSSTVEVTLEPDGDATLVRLVHTGLPVAERAQHQHGWEHYLQRLSVSAAGGDPGPDPMAAAPAAQATEG
jgi:uncharacterized protein YndB with AHSA1/START domain